MLCEDKTKSRRCQHKK